LNRLASHLSWQNVGCPETKALVFQEIQRGAEPMKKKRFYAKVGTTAACTLRLIVGAEYCGQGLRERRLAKENERRLVVVADSWFGSVKLAEALKLLRRVVKRKPDGTEDGYFYVIDKEQGQNPNGHELIAAVKTNSSWFPKAAIEEKMRNWPSGSYLVLECCTPETNVDLVAIGYKYNARKVLQFIMSKNAGSTAPGTKPYIAKYPDKYGNIKERRVPRPEAIGVYFDDSNVIDSHNHCRQHLLGLERHWHTDNPWFRNDCTWVGMTAIDGWRGIQYHCSNLKLSVEDYADALAWDCIHNPYTKASSSTRTYLAPDSGSGVSSLQQGQVLIENQRDRMLSFMDLQMDGLEDRLQNMVISASAGRLSNESALSTSTIDVSEFAGINIGEHDPIPIDQLNAKDNRPVKRRCCICRRDTRSQCSNAGCRSVAKQHNGKMFYGTWVCDPQVGARKNLTNYPDNTLTCLQLHRNEIRQRKLAEYKDRIANRASH
jgi:hypothetical protein